MTTIAKISTSGTLVSSPQVQELIESFISSQDVKPSSRKLYRRTIKQYFVWIDEEELDLSQVSRVEVLQYKQSLLDSGLSTLSVASYLTAVRKFYSWTESEKLYPNVATGIKTPRKKRQFRKQALTPEMSKEFLSFYEGGVKRDYAIVNLLLRTGLRTIEARRANVEDITFKQGKRVLLVHGKGRDEKDSFVILSDKAYQPIAEYLETRGRVLGGEPLFISDSNNSKGGRLSTRTISKTAKEGLKAIGLDTKDFTAHSLRHSTAVNILRAGGTLLDVQDVLRHSSTDTSQIYTATIKEEMRIKNAPEELLDSII